jgi:hypothetical protein
LRAPEPDTEPRESVRRVQAIRKSLPRRDRHLIDLYLQEGGNMSAVARRLHRKLNGMRNNFRQLFARVRQQLA